MFLHDQFLPIFFFKIKKKEKKLFEVKSYHFIQTFCFCSFQCNSLAIICITRGKASSAASTFKNERRVRLASISTAVRAYSLIA